uniref:Glycosyltransferase family 92 protein n=1 Tax=Strongyloides papillosus TaxID=174720 RepID=A0A0N5BDN6_STREA
MYINNYSIFATIIFIFILFEFFLISLNSNQQTSSKSEEIHYYLPEYNYSEKYYLEYLTPEILEGEVRLRYSLKLGKAIPTFWKSQYLRNLDCKKLLRGDQAYVNEARQTRHKYKFVSDSFPVSCSDIQMRGYYPNESMSKEEAEYPLAFAINVFHDYLKIEQYFLLMYAPQNQFCYAIDKKSSPDFKKKVRNLAKCFTNVHVVEKEYPMDHTGVNGNLYNYECMKLLNGKNYKYLFILQNDDVPLKTNRELVQIMKLYNGSVDMDFGNSFTNHPINIAKNVSLKYKDLNIFREGDKRLEDPKVMNSKLMVQKGFLEAALPKEAVDYVVNVLNISTLINNLNSGLPYTDEIFWPTIMTSPELQVPGWQHYKCSKNKKFSYFYYTRRSIYTTYKKCLSKSVRHGVCLFGVEVLHNLKSWPQFFGNKFYSEFDAGASICWSEYMYEKKFFEFDKKIDESIYTKSPLIKYQKYKDNVTDLNVLCDLALK